jgi:hypothetical protein
MAGQLPLKHRVTLTVRDPMVMTHDSACSTSVASIATANSTAKERDTESGKYPVTPTISWPRGHGESSADSRMAQAGGAPFDCSIAGGCE